MVITIETRWQRYFLAPYIERFACPQHSCVQWMEGVTGKYELYIRVVKTFF